MRASTRVTVVLGLVSLALLVGFAVTNGGQVIELDFWLWRWQGKAVFAIYAGICTGLVLMFLLGLPADLAARREREQLAQRLRRAEENPSTLED